MVSDTNSMSLWRQWHSPMKRECATRGRAQLAAVQSQGAAAACMHTSFFSSFWGDSTTPRKLSYSVWSPEDAYQI